jgi:hypothetical protein
MRGGESAALAALALAVSASAAARPHSADPMDWLVQHACVGAGDRPLPVDPYDGCPAGASERRLRRSDPMPYRRHDQPGANGDHPDGYQRHDAYPILDVRTGAIVAANDFDFDYSEPYGAAHPGDGDGFDAYRVADGYATGGGTRDGGGYSQTFFGPDCRPYGGWIFFPVGFLRSLRPGAAGRGVFPLRGEYWEQNGEPWPGRCEPDRGFSRDTLTTWSFAPGTVFGGRNGAREKRIDAIVSTHGLPARPAAGGRYHLERFFFTDLYGLTRWEAWAPSADQPKASGNCGGDERMTYEGFSFTRADCRDWSVVDVLAPPAPRAPWPYPESNLLRNWHFDESGLKPWQRTGPTDGRGALRWRRLESRAPADLRYSRNGVGVRYLKLDCGGGPCGAGAAMFQDAPAASLPAASAYVYGFSGAVEGARDGTMTAALSQLDADGREVWRASFDAEVGTGYRGRRPSDSVYAASTTYLRESPPFALAPGAVALRFSLTPGTTEPIDVLDAWLMPR